MIDFDSLSKKQLDTLGEIACNQDGGHNERTLKSLLDRGLIEHYEECLGIVVIDRYRVPSNVHIAWCEWCSKEES